MIDSRGVADLARQLTNGTLTPDETARATALLLVAIFSELQLLRRDLNTIAQNAGSVR